jgi:hypothetical protein
LGFDAVRRGHPVGHDPSADTATVQDDTDPAADDDLVRPTVGNGVVEEPAECGHIGAHAHVARAGHGDPFQGADP